MRGARELRPVTPRRNFQALGPADHPIGGLEPGRGGLFLGAPREDRTITLSLARAVTDKVLVSLNRNMSTAAPFWPGYVGARRLDAVLMLGATSRPRRNPAALARPKNEVREGRSPADVSALKFFLSDGALPPAAKPPNCATSVPLATVAQVSHRRGCQPSDDAVYRR